jgi:RNA polymerase sigma-70 factor (ECF subfamily)
MQIGDEQDAWMRLQQGDESGLRWLFDRYYKALVADAYRILKDADACQDMVQDAFAELWIRRQTLVIQYQVGGYLRRMVVNKALNYLKTSKRYQYGDEAAWADLKVEVSAQVKEDRHVALEHIVQAAIEQLPEKCRLVFVLSRFEDKSNREIADALGISVKTVENQMTKALRVLRNILHHRPDLSCIFIYVLKTGWLTWGLSIYCCL